MKVKKILSVLIAILMLSALFSFSGYAVNDGLTVQKGKSVATETVSFSLSGFDGDIFSREYTVSSDMSEKYGFVTADKDHNGVEVNGVTFFDVLVAVHEDIYGEQFKSDPGNYLVMNSGYILKAFGKSASASSFIVNGVMPNDGIINSEYGTFTCYSCDTARISSGDKIVYFLFQDTSFYSDNYAWFDSDEYAVPPGEALTVNLKGYCAMYYGANSFDVICEKYANNLEGIEIFGIVNGEEVLLGTTDKNGNAELTFENEGEYVIVARGETSDEEPVIPANAIVKVGEKKQTVWQRIEAFFKSIADFFADIINKIKNLFN